MRVLFENKIATWFDSFDIFDEIGRKLFHVGSKSRDGVRKLKIYECGLHNRSVATIREVAEPAGVEIKHGTRFVSVVEKVFSKLRRMVGLGFLNWQAAGEFREGTFCILDANDRVVASVGETFFGHREVRYVDSLPEFLLHALTFTLAIDVQVSESEAADFCAAN